MSASGKNALQRLLIIVLLCSPISGMTILTRRPLAPALSLHQFMQNNSSQKSVPCAEALKHVPQIKVGMSASEVLDLLGEPVERVEQEWGYNFFACAPHPRVGVQTVTGLSLIFQNGVVKEIKYAWIDATGPGPGSTPAPKRKKRSPRASQED